MMLTMNDGAELELVRMFGTDRAIVLVSGLRVIAVLTPSGWDAMTGEPARPGEELEVLNGLVKDGTTVTVTDPSGATTTFEDP